MIVRFPLISLFLIGISLFAKEGELPPCKEGNFALPPSQQPGPLIGFGENIIGRNEFQLFLFGDSYVGETKHFVDLVPGILYGITDRSSLFLNVPIAGSYRLGDQSSEGLEDLFLQFEYALYTNLSSCSSDQVTLVANVSFPTGSSHKTPPTGFGAFGYFLGTTYNRTWQNWFCFTSYGVEIPMSHEGTRFGDQLLYQFGFGRNITNTETWIFAWMVELDGTFSAKNRIQKRKDPNSGGNVIYVTPSLWASSKGWIAQLGGGYALQQNAFGHQERNRYLIAFNFGRTL